MNKFLAALIVAAFATTGVCAADAKPAAPAASAAVKKDGTKTEAKPAAKPAADAASTAKK